MTTQPSARRRASAGLTALLCAVVATATLGAAPAAAAPPANDARTTPQAVATLPATLRGTTAEATLEPDEPASICGRAIKGSVWYSFTATSTRSVIIALDAAGDMDATLDVFARQRSQLSPVACRPTGSRGESTIDLDVESGTSYLVRVAPLSNSVAEAFSLLLVEPDRPARAPGPRLPASGTAATVDRFANPDDAWSTTLQRGRTYRLNFVTKGRGCARVSLHPPGSGFGSGLLQRHCDAHVVFAAPESGRYSIHVEAPRASRQALAYRLRVGPALTDDTAPGLRLAEDRPVRGTLTGSELDALDLYRFSVVRRSDLRLSVRARGDLTLDLRTTNGRRLAFGSFLDRRLNRGHYFVAVRSLDGADSSYVLRRVTRAITSAATLIDGRRHRSVPAGRSVVLSVAVRPSVSGRASMLVERFDPIDGWLFHARFRPAVASGRAAVTFRPPSVGRWRLTGEFDGTRIASPSDGGRASLVVTEPVTG